MAIVRDQK